MAEQTAMQAARKNTANMQGQSLNSPETLKQGAAISEGTVARMLSQGNVEGAQRQQEAFQQLLGEQTVGGATPKRDGISSSRGVTDTTAPQATNQDMQAPTSTGEPGVPGLGADARDDINRTYADMADIIDQQADVLATTRDRKIESIQRQFNALRQRQQVQNREFLGQSKGFLGRAGAFSSQSGQSVIKKEIQAGEDRIAKLIADEQAAISAALEDFESNNLELAKERLALAEEKRVAIQEARVQQLNEMLQYENILNARSDREQTEFERNLQKLDLLGAYNPDQVTEGTLDMFDAYLGMGEGFTRNYLTTAQAAREQEFVNAQYEQLNSMTQMLARVPENQSITLPDGTTVQGFKEVTPNTLSTWSTDNAGNVTLLTYDQDTGDYTIVPFGGVGKNTIRTVSGSGSSTTGITTDDAYAYLMNGGDLSVLGQKNTDDAIAAATNIPKPSDPQYATWSQSVSKMGYNPAELYFRAQQSLLATRSGGEVTRQVGTESVTVEDEDTGERVTVTKPIMETDPGYQALDYAASAAQEFDNYMDSRLNYYTPVDMEQDFSQFYGESQGGVSSPSVNTGLRMFFDYLES